jgi:hypothetical protein
MSLGICQFAIYGYKKYQPGSSAVGVAEEVVGTALSTCTTTLRTMPTTASIRLNILISKPHVKEATE